MNRKKQYKKFIALLKDQPVSLALMIVLGLMLWAGDYSLSNQIYLLIFEITWQANLMAAFIGAFFAATPKLTAYQFAKGNYWLGVIGLIIMTFFIFILFIGQKEVIVQSSHDLLSGLLGDANPINEVQESKVHYIATGLLSVLCLFSLFISFQYFSAKRGSLPLDKLLLKRFVLRKLQSEIQLVDGNLQRLEDKPRNFAESKVHQNIQELEDSLHLQQQELNRHDVLKEIDERFYENLRSRVILAIYTTYMINNNSKS